MRLTWAALGLIGLIAGCGADETVTQYGGADYLWQLQDIDGEAVDYAASLQFEEDGGVRGDGPCNAFIANQSLPYPWVEITIDVVEQIYCPDIDREEAFFDALTSMSLIEVSGPILLMRNDAGREMVFNGVTPDAAAGL